MSDPSLAFEAIDLTDPQWYYEVGTKQFWVRADDGAWVSMPKADFETYLSERAHMVPYRDRAGGQKVNPVKSATLDAIMNRRISWAGRLAGWHRGLQSIAGADILVTDSPELIDPEHGDWPLLDQFLSGLLISQDTDGRKIDQRPYLYGWLKTSLQALYAGRPSQGLAVVLAGERNSGKTLLKEFIREMFGKREVMPFSYISGQDRFNRNLAESVLWVVDDESYQHKRVDRQHLKGQIKKITANTRWECRGMHRDAETIETMRRLMICVNIDPDCLTVLPDIDEDIVDKISMFKCESGAIPWPMNTQDEKRAFYNAVLAELPYFVDFLLNHHRIDPKHVGRFEIIHFQHPIIRDELLAISPEMTLYEHIERTLFDQLHTIWEGPAADLHQALTSDDSPLSHRQRNSIPDSAILGKRLSKLISRFPGRFSKEKKKGNWIYTLRKENIGQKEANDDSFQP